jgi:hypothetical protein
LTLKRTGNAPRWHANAQSPDHPRSVARGIVGVLQRAAIPGLGFVRDARKRIILMDDPVPCLAHEARMQAPAEQVVAGIDIGVT